MQGKLERAALKIDDLWLRPDVIFNFLTIKHALHGGPPPPDLAAIEDLMAQHGGLPAHIHAHARRVYDTSVERATAPSDVANVRAAAQSATFTTAADDAEAAAAPAGEELPPTLAAVGLLQMPQQEMDAVVAGVEQMVRGAGLDGGDEPRDGSEGVVGADDGGDGGGGDTHDGGEGVAGGGDTPAGGTVHGDGGERNAAGLLLIASGNAYECSLIADCY